MRIQTNPMALNSNRQLSRNNSEVAKSLEKLSSGYRINRAGDDAAGLAISEKMRAQIKGLTAATDNSQDAISLVQTAEGGLQEVHSMLNRMQELATKSSNGTYTNDVDRKALQDEIVALKDEINRIADSMNFNGIKLLDGSMGVGTSGATSTTTVSATNGTVAATKFELSAPEGYTVNIVNSTGGPAPETAVWTANNKTLTITLNKDTEYTQEQLNGIIAGATGTPAEAVGKISLSVDKKFKTGATGDAANNMVSLTSAAAAQAKITGATSGITFTAGKAGEYYNGKGLTIGAGASVGASINGTTGAMTLNLESGKSYSASQINDMLAKAGIDITTSFDGTKTVTELSNGNAAYTFAGGAGLSSGGGLKLQIGDTNDAWNQLDLSIADMHMDALGIGVLDIGTREGASAAISKITDAINKVSTSRGKLGAIQNRLEHTINNLGVTTENITAAESRIRDVDMAKEMMEFTKNSVLMQSAQAMLAQANQQPQSILQLLQ